MVEWLPTRREGQPLPCNDVGAHFKRVLMGDLKLIGSPGDSGIAGRAGRNKNGPA